MKVVTFLTRNTHILVKTLKTLNSFSKVGFCIFTLNASRIVKSLWNTAISLEKNQYCTTKL